jgi:hypothetical protein
MSAAFAPEYRPAFEAPRPSSADPVPISSLRPAGGRTTVRVLIASHQPIVRHGLRGLLLAEPEIEIVGESDDGGDAVGLARRLRPDLVLIDMGIQTLDAIAVTRMIRSELPDTQVMPTTASTPGAPPSVDVCRGSLGSVLGVRMRRGQQ